MRQAAGPASPPRAVVAAQSGSPVSAVVQNWVTQVFGYAVGISISFNAAAPRAWGPYSKKLAAAVRNLNVSDLSTELDIASVRKTGHIDRAIGRSLLKIKAALPGVSGIFMRASGKLA